MIESSSLNKKLKISENESYYGGTESLTTCKTFSYSNGNSYDGSGKKEVPWDTLTVMLMTIHLVNSKWALTNGVGTYNGKIRHLQSYVAEGKPNGKAFFYSSDIAILTSKGILRVK